MIFEFVLETGNPTRQWMVDCFNTINDEHTYLGHSIHQESTGRWVLFVVTKEEEEEED